MEEDPGIERWREAYRQLSGTNAPCPGDEALADLVLEELAADERESVVEHLLECRSCAASYRDLVDLHMAVTRRRPRRTTAWVALSAAAAALLLLVLFKPFPIDPGSGSGDEALRSAAAGSVTPADGAHLENGPTSLTWPAEAGATGYRVELYDQRAGLVWEGVANGATRIELPSASVEALQPGSYFWVVVVSGPAASSRLGPYWFHLD